MTFTRETKNSYSVFISDLIPTGEWIGTVTKRADGWHIGGFGPVSYQEALPTRKAAGEKMAQLHRAAFPTREATLGQVAAQGWFESPA